MIYKFYLQGDNMSDPYDEDTEGNMDDNFLAEEGGVVDEDALDTLAQEFPELDDADEDSRSGTDE